MGIDTSISDFWAYKPSEDSTAPVSSAQLFREFMPNKATGEKSAVSTFASVVNCPYRIVNLGLGHKPKFSRAQIQNMAKGSKAHRAREVEIQEAAETSLATGGPPDLKTAPQSLRSVAAENLLEATEITVSLSVGDLDLKGRADGLLRTDGVIVAVERKPRTRAFQPASTLQAMAYAIGGCLTLGSDKASNGAKWMVSDYSGSMSRSGAITEHVCDLFKEVGSAYLSLLNLGKAGSDVPELPGPGRGKCSKCEFQQLCRFKVLGSTSDRDSQQEPPWLKYAKRE